MRKICLIIFLILAFVACSEPEYMERTGVIIKKNMYQRQQERICVQCGLGKYIK